MGSVAPSTGPVLAPSLSLMGHRSPETSVAYAAPLLMPMQHQPCLQQYVVCGGGPESSAAASVQGGQQFGRHVIQLPPAVSEQAWTTSGVSQEIDFEFSPPPPPPPPVCPPHLPSQQHCAVPPSLPPSA